jgi:hypothetical protein
MNMSSDKLGQAAQRLEFGNMASHSTEEMPSNSQCACGFCQENHRWDVFITALERARKTRNRGDVRAAHAAWLHYLVASFPDEKERSQVPVPAFVREWL